MVGLNRPYLFKFLKATPRQILLDKIHLFHPLFTFSSKKQKILTENYSLLTKYLAGTYFNDDNLSLACPYFNFLFNVITGCLTYIYRNIYCFCIESKHVSKINIMEKML